MRIRLPVCVVSLSSACLLTAAVLSGQAWAQTPAQPPSPPNAYPPALAEALLKRKEAEAAAAGQTPAAAAFALFSNNYFWPAGQNLIVAFHGGRYEVWSEVAKIAAQWSTVANVTFDFGLNPKTKTARMWDPSDPSAVAAHVRVRLDVNDPFTRYAAVGREAFQKEFESGTLVLGGLVAAYPLWSAEDRADILHEFGHALGFLHEQQRPECTQELRLVKGPNGEPTIYEVYQDVYRWDEVKTRTNLLLAASYKATASGPLDKRSLFMYPTIDPVLPATLNGTKGPCYVKKKNLTLSSNDIERARREYPFDTDNTITNLALSNIETLKQVVISGGAGLGAAPLLQRLESAEKALRPLVYIQVATAEQRGTGNALRRQLLTNGYIAPAVENIAGKATPPGRPEVRYFTTGDADQARSVADLMQRELGGTPVATRLIVRKQERKSPLEVWLSP